MICYYRQGDILLEKISNNNDDDYAKTKYEKIQNQDNIIAHGESGNQHRMNKQVILFEDKNKREDRFVQVLSQNTELVHQEHAKIEIPQGLYKIRREREYNAFEQSIRQVQD